MRKKATSDEIKEMLEASNSYIKLAIDIKRAIKGVNKKLERTFSRDFGSACCIERCPNGAAPNTKNSSKPRQTIANVWSSTAKKQSFFRQPFI